MGPLSPAITVATALWAVSAGRARHSVAVRWPVSGGQRTARPTKSDRPQVRTLDGFVLRRTGGYRSFSFGAVLGDHGFV